MRIGSRLIVVVPVVFLAASAFSSERDEMPGVATVNAAGVTGATEVAGDPVSKTVGRMTVFVPPALAVRGRSFDVVVHFHGASKLQAENVTEAGLRAAVVSVNEGAGSAQYTRAMATEDALQRILSVAEREVRAARQGSELSVGRVALSAWSAGGAAVRAALEQDPERVDAVIIADGLFSAFGEDGSVMRRPLEPFVAFGERALRGERLFVLTHTAIETPDYPNVEACTTTLLEALGVPREAPSSVAPPGGGAPTYAVRRGGFEVRGYDGKGREAHVEQVKALDAAYGELRRRWAD